jgi:hypothetical protein
MLALFLFCTLGHMSEITAPFPMPYAEDEERPESLERETGSILHLSGDMWVIVPDSDAGSRYQPRALPNEFKKDGLRVIFSGSVGEIPDNVRLYGTPLELTSIELLEE